MNKIKLENLHINDEILISYPLNQSYLIDSIKKAGLINPLLVQPRSSGGFEVICGHRRFAACRELNFKEINCNVIEEPLNILQALILNIQDNRVTRVFNPVEMSIIINQLEKFITPQEIIADYLPLLGLNPHARIRDKIVPLAKLDDSIKMSIIYGNLHPDTAYRLSCLDITDRTAIFDVLRNVHLSSSKQLEIIVNLETVSLRGGNSIRDLIYKSAIIKTAEDPDTPPNLKGEKIREILHKWVYPRYSRAQRDYLSNIKKLKIPHRMDITPPPYFEGEDYKISLSFKSLEELKKHLSKLNELIDNPALLEILKTGTKHD